MRLVQLRTNPGVNIRPFRPGDEIRTASADDTAHWQAVAKGLNLALDEVGCDPVIADGCRDGQLISLNGEGPTLQLRYQIAPMPSDKHTTVEVAIYASSTDDTGLVSISALQDGGVAVPIAISGVNPSWRSANVPVDTSGGHEELTFAVSGACRILDWVAQPVLTGVEDGANKRVELPAGEYASGVVPIDIDDVAGGEPFSSDIVDDMAAINTHVRDRNRQIIATCAPLSPSGGFDGWLARRPIRGLLPVPVQGAQVEFRVYATGVVNASHLTIQAGPGGRDHIYNPVQGRSLHTVNIPAAAAAAWYTKVVDIPDALEQGAPEGLPGWTHIAALPGGDAKIHAVCAWVKQAI